MICRDDFTSYASRWILRKYTYWHLLYFAIMSHKHTFYFLSTTQVFTEIQLTYVMLFLLGTLFGGIINNSLMWFYNTMKPRVHSQPA